MKRYSAQCPECERMLRRFVEAGASRTLAEQDLARYRSNGSDGFDSLWKTCEEARQEQELLHLKLIEHMETHSA